MTFEGASSVIISKASTRDGLDATSGSPNRRITTA
jgi:hypothetical protein